ncbi:MAG TPA: hypothetical protein VGS80_17795 [Ktedonobacterales bacterium]|nr:hypothetical protein [Ktedonobacterales bacterium]
MLPIALVFVLSLLLALVCSAIPWLARPLGSWTLAIVLVVGIAVGLLSLVFALPLYPWSDLVVLLVAWSGGLLLGRWVAPHFRPFLLVFLCFSAVDVLQFAVGLSASSAAGPPTPVNATALHVGDFLLLLPWGRFAINIVDLLLITTLAEHWRRRGTPYFIAVLPSAVGFLLADGFILVTGRGFLPGIPFFTAGYLVSEGVYRYVSRHRAPPSAQSARQGPVARGTGS